MNEISQERPETRARRRTERQAEALLNLARRALLSGSELQALLGEVNRISAEALGVERAGVWLFSRPGEALELENLYRRSADSHEKGFRLHAADFPLFFRALAEEGLVVVDNVAEDPRTRELVGPYFEPLGIGGVLEAPIYVEGRLEGALSYEHVGGPRPWAPDERTFAAAMANLVGMGIAQARLARATRELAEAKERYRRLVECVTDLLLVHDLEGRFVEANDEACRFLGYAREELLGMFVSRIDLGYDGVESPRLWTSLEGGRPVLRETVYRRKDGTPAFVELRLGRVELAGKSLVLCVARDMTERRRLEGTLRQIQRLDALGRLAGGVAHDFNNFLTVISGFARLLAGTLSEGAARRYAGEILQAAEQASEVTRQLLAFSQKQVLAPRPVNLNRVIRESESLLRSAFPENVRLEFLLSEQLSSVKADPAQLQQVLVTLVLRARDTVGSGGTVTIETREVHLEKPEPAHGGDVAPGDYVVLSVSDTGRGLDAEARARLFEPFAGLGEEKGLALATVYGIVRQHGGYLRVLSALGEGTRFDLFLPRIDEAEKAGTAPQEAAGAHPGGREGILVAEDSDSVRGLIREVLRGRGYRVFEARNGKEGLDVFRRRAEEIDLVVTDVVMPEMSGPEMVGHMRARAPLLPVLFLSAYPDYAVESQGRLDLPLAWFLAKPFTPAEFLAEVARIISAYPRARRP